MGNVVVARFVGSGSWLLARCSDDVSHFLGGSRHGRCVRAMARGLEIRVLDGANTRSLAGYGCESYAEVRCC